MVKEKSFEYGIIKPLIISLSVSVVSSLIFMLLGAVAVTNLNVGEDTVLIFAILSMSIGVFFGGFFGAKFYKKKGYLIGGLNGFFFFLIITLISLILNNSPITVISLFKLILFVISSIIGGIIGVNTSRKRKI